MIKQLLFDRIFDWKAMKHADTLSSLTSRMPKKLKSDEYMLSRLMNWQETVFVKNIHLADA